MADDDKNVIPDAFDQELSMVIGPGTPKFPSPMPSDVPKGDDLDDPSKTTKVPSDDLEPAEKPSGDVDPTSVRFPEHEPTHVPDAGDDLGLPPSEGADPGIPPSDLELPPDDGGGVDVPGLGHLDEGDLMPPEVQDVSFPEPDPSLPEDPGFSLEPPSDFGASDEVPSDSIDGFDGGAIDDGF